MKKKFNAKHTVADSHIELTLGIKALICKMELMYEAQNKTNTMLGKLLEIAEALADSDDSDDDEGNPVTGLYLDDEGNPVTGLYLDDEGNPVTGLYLDGSPMFDYSNGVSGEV